MRLYSRGQSCDPRTLVLVILPLQRQGRTVEAEVKGLLRAAREAVRIGNGDRVLSHFYRLEKCS